MSALQPPRINTQDAGTRDIDESSDDHFSSASEGSSNPKRLSGAESPIPITRVERVDDSAAHGEVPGTPAYDQRAQDAVPDEIEIVPEGRRSRSATATGTRSRAGSHVSESRGGSRPATPGGTPIPRTVVEKVDFEPSHGEVDGTEAKELRLADAAPDEVRRAPVVGRGRLEGRDREVGSGDDEGRQAWFRSMWEGEAEQPKQDEEENEEEEMGQDASREEEDDDHDFGDDFDDFAEGGGDDDFGDFDEGEEGPAMEQAGPAALSADSDILATLPPLDLSTCTTPAEISEAITPYINAILPHSTTTTTPLDPSSTHQTTPFLSDRSLSLWQQLVSPPPMQPPNWTRSRIRRLFLVSLGVPVDLDEILPPSKQKRLVLPSLTNFEGRPSTALDRLKEEEPYGGANDSTTSLDSKTGVPKASSKTRSKPARKGPPPPPEFDLNAAAHLCATTERALSVYSDEELKEHVFTLEVLNSRASRVLEYWLVRRDEGLKEKEALEGVIENFVGFVKGRRGR